MILLNKIFNKKDLYFYRSFLEYIPSYWEFDKILEKKVIDLTDIDIERLVHIKRDKMYIYIINYLINIINKSDNSYGDMVSVIISEDDYLEIMDAFKYLKDTILKLSKLNMNELNIIFNIIDSNKDKSKFLILSKLDHISNDFVREYAIYLLKRMDSNCLLESIDKKIKVRN